MNAQRAQEISESPVIANVLYNGMKVYIQHVNEDNETARIYPLDDPQKEQEVPLNQLIEQ
ncbi:small acid-soluble spore protein H [Ureibacillus sp. 179-F W5.1 NHS]|uniref:Small, acid-soluble spore protein H n=2 Tax=Bacillales TaxID=1385 RepID=A0A3M8HFN7_9BACI|nr:MULTISPECIES: small acid-soluble spore protein H [Bacillales]MBD8025648.1 small acid-soluble spore protein H [Ureibacillus galli]RND01145.1 small acid-soluble spore protein H [Lysinibacillus halotolerans]